jgi:hypothetical protein
MLLKLASAITPAGAEGDIVIVGVSLVLGTTGLNAEDIVKVN